MTKTILNNFYNGSEGRLTKNIYFLLRLVKNNPGVRWQTTDDGGGGFEN